MAGSICIYATRFLWIRQQADLLILPETRIMFIQQLYTGCLSEAAYFIESEGEAAVIDPLRDVEHYLQLASERNATIRYIFETHFHADFVSGHLDLAAKTGAPIVYGPRTETAFPIHLARDGERFRIGKLELEAIHTPGHTIESTCYLLRDHHRLPRCLFTGDTLFVGDVGRPDLFGGSMTSAGMASMLFDSLEKIKKLPDEVIIYPAHGAGSSCGKNIGSETSSTIGEQKRTNYALLAPSREAFILQVIEGLSTPPQYFPLNASINKEGYAGLDEVMERSLRPLGVDAFRGLVLEGAFILDTRNADEFAEGFIPKSLQIGLKGRFAEWAGILVPFDKPLVLVVDPGMESEAITRLARVGFDRVSGYLEGGIGAWKAAGQKTDMVVTVEPEELALDLPFDPGLLVLDVRRHPEFVEGHVRGAMNRDLNGLGGPATDLKNLEHRNIYVHCESGYRSMIACSILKKAGIQNLRNVNGGYQRLKLLSTMPIITETSVLN